MEEKSIQATPGRRMSVQDEESSEKNEETTLQEGKVPTLLKKCICF